MKKQILCAILLISIVQLQNVWAQNKHIKLVNFYSSNCSNHGMDIDKNQNRIISQKLSHDTLSVTIGIMMNCSGPRIQEVDLKDSVLLLYINQYKFAPKWKLQNMIVEESTCDCCFTFTFLIKGVKTEPKIVKYNDEQIALTSHKYKIVPEKYEIANGDTSNRTNIYGFKVGKWKGQGMKEDKIFNEDHIFDQDTIRFSFYSTQKLNFQFIRKVYEYDLHRDYPVFEEIYDECSNLVLFRFKLFWKDLMAKFQENGKLISLETNLKDNKSIFNLDSVRYTKGFDENGNLSHLQFFNKDFSYNLFYNKNGTPKILAIYTEKYQSYIEFYENGVMRFVDCPEIKRSCNEKGEIVRLWYKKYED